MTNAQALAQAFADYEGLDDYIQEGIADYINCPNSADCAWDGKAEHNFICTECKMRWLEQEWEG